MKIAFFDAKPYDLPAFKRQGELKNIDFRFFDTRLTADTASLAEGCEGVCIFVNDCADAEVINRLHSLGVKILALRCAGYNNVDLKSCYGKIHAAHVPAYSPPSITLVKSMYACFVSPAILRKPSPSTPWPCF